MQDDGNTNAGNGVNPTANGTEQQGVPYADYLSRLPEGVRPLVEPMFKEWDAGVTKRFQELHSQYEPWTPIVSEYDPEGVQQAIMLAQAIEADPQGVYQALGEAYGFVTPDDDTDDTDTAGSDEDNPYEERFRKTEEMIGTIAEILLGQREEQSESQEDAELDTYLGQLKEQYGDFDEDYVLTKMAAGLSGDDAIKSYQQLIESRAATRNQASVNAPRVMGSGGGLPSNQVDPTKLDGQSTRSLIAQMLAAAAQES